MKSSGIGGQAVLEGVMMKNKNRYAVAIRKPNGEIVVEKGECTSLKEKSPFFGLPIVRGVVSFLESLVLGAQMLTSSAAYFEDEEEPGKLEKWLTEKFGKKSDKIIMGGAVLLGILLAFGLFTLLPLAVITLIPDDVMGYSWKAFLEGVLRLAIFLVYLALISANRDMKRVFMYHGAEHKAINCIESGRPLNLKNVKRSSRRHKRCGTSFLLFVILISIIFFIFVRVETFWLRLLVRVLFVPLLAGVSYEFIRLAGASDSKVTDLLSKPGLWLQGLTTREPNDEMIKAAIASMEAVFDWEAYLRENFYEKEKGKKTDKGAADRKKEPKKETDKKAAVLTKKEAEPENGKSASPREAGFRKEQKTGTVTERKQDAPKEEKQEDLSAKFDMSFVRAEEVPKEMDEEEAAILEEKMRRSWLISKVSAADRAETAGKQTQKEIAAAGEEEEEDEILKALDQYFVFDGEKTVMERRENGKK